MTARTKTTPTMMTPRTPGARPLESECAGGAVEDALAEEVLAEEVLAEDVCTPEAPKIAPGPYSGPSKSNVGARP
jgi:hypothetical protein